MNNFDVIEQVGEGGQGRCYLIRYRRSGKKAIMKKVKHFQESGGDALEARILCDFLPRHPNILRILGSDYSPANWRHAKQLTTFYEYHPGGTLHNVMANYPHGHVPEGFIRRVFRHIAQALALMHYGYDHRYPDSGPPGAWRPVIHRDIKPDNIFLTTKFGSRRDPLPDIVLGDFGFASDKPYTEATPVLKYCPPELPISSAKGDVWSLGAVIHELAHGRPPIRDVPKGSGMSKDDWLMLPEARKPLYMPSRYSDESNDVMWSCLEMKPGDRISSFDLLQQILK